MPLFCQTSNISRTLASIQVVDHSDAVGASPVTAAPIRSSFLTQYLVSMFWSQKTERRDNKHLNLAFSVPYIRGLTIHFVLIFSVKEGMCKQPGLEGPRFVLARVKIVIFSLCHQAVNPLRLNVITFGQM